MLSHNIRQYLKVIGKKGGRARARKLSVAARASQAQNAVMLRWMRKRFGADSFEEMGIPGWEIVDLGLRDLANKNFSSVSALVVTELRPRLRFLGVSVPDVSKQISNPRQMLYSKMEQQHGDMAYARFCALLERVDSFCDALASIRSVPASPAHRHRRWCA